jgi:hypothetical protein
VDFEKVVQEIENEQGTFVSVLKYHGAFHQDLIHRMLDQLNERVLSTGDEKKIAARVYSVVYELMNNVLFHAKLFQENEAAGFIVVRRNDTEYKIDSGNLIDTTSEEHIKSIVSEINSMAGQILNEEHTKRMKHGLQEGKVGEGLGFVQLRKIVDKPLAVRFSYFAEYSSIYTVTCAVSRV